MQLAGLKDKERVDFCESDKNMDPPKTKSKYSIKYSEGGETCEAFDCVNSNIDAGELIIAQLYTRTLRKTTKYTPKWFHVACIFNLKVITTPQVFHTGWDAIKSEDKEAIEKRMANSKVVREKHTKTKKRVSKEEDNSNSDSEEKKRKKKPKKKTKKVLARASVSLTTTAFPLDVWAKVCGFLPTADVMKVSLLSRVCRNAARRVWLRNKGLTVNRRVLKSPDEIPPFALQVEKLTVKNKPIAWLANFPNVTSLNIAQGDPFELLAVLPSLKKLTHLSVPWRAADLDYLSKIPNLQALRLSHIIINVGLTTLTNSLQCLSSCHNLTRLDLVASTLLPDCIPAFEQLKQLAHFSFVCDDFSGGHKFDLSRMESLSSLAVYKLRVMKHLELPHSLVRLKVKISRRMYYNEQDEAPTFPTTLRSLDLKLRGTPLWLEELLKLHSTCIICLRICLFHAGPESVPLSVMSRLNTLHLECSYWPANRTTLDILENLVIPPLLFLDIDLDDCKYKKKVIAEVEKLKTRANNLVLHMNK